MYLQPELTDVKLVINYPVLLQFSDTSFYYMQYPS
jgi:hypothetical protein